jgi:hypothetical protein
MIPIQPILIGLLVLAAVLCIWSLRFRLVMRIVCVGLAATGVTFVLHPDFTNRLAKMLGVGRGADLLLYLFSVACVYALLVLYVRQRELRYQMTQLARSFALEHAVKPDENRPMHNEVAIP